MSTLRLTKLELEILLVALNSSKCQSIRRLVLTIPNLCVHARETSSVGFFTKFLASPHRSDGVASGAKVEQQRAEALGFHPETDGVINFFVWIKEGEIECIEGAASDHMPDDFEDIVVGAYPD